MTLQDIITNVSTNLGNRAEGKIGNQTVEAVALTGINSALIQCVKEADPEYYNRDCEIIIDTTNRIFEMPTQDLSGEDIRVKDIVWYRTSYADTGSAIHMQRLPYRAFVQHTRNWDQNLTGIPNIWSFKSNKVYTDRINTNPIRLTLFVEVFPEVLTTAELNVSLPLADEWNLALEAYATHLCYTKLQQIQLAEYWFGIFEREKRQTIRTQRKSNGRAQEQDPNGYGGPQPWNNPLVNNWN